MRRLHMEPLEDRRVLAVLTVDTPLDVIDFTDGVMSLREAVFVANSVSGQDTIEFDNALLGAAIDLTLGEIEIAESLDISQASNDPVTINAQGQSRIFNITATTGDFTIGNLVLTGGMTSGSNLDDSDTTFSGGTIRSLTSGELTLNRTLITSSKTTGDYAKGGGVFADGNVILAGARVEYSSTSGDFAPGGGVYADGELTLVQRPFSSAIIANNSTTGEFSGGGGAFAGGGMSSEAGIISRNSTEGADSPGGGALILGNASLAYTGLSLNSTVGTNSAGGGIAVLGDNVLLSGDVTFSEGLISDNSTSGNVSAGGAIFSNGSVSVHVATVSNNTTGGQQSFGGAIYAQAGVDFLSSTISNNLTSGSQAHGGAVFSSGDVNLAHVTATANRAAAADALGGGIYAGPSATVTLSHTILAGNDSGGTAPDLYHVSGVIDSQYSLIGSSVGTSLIETTVNAPDIMGNLIGGPKSGPIDPKLLPLQHNGGGAETHLPKPDSPALNAGDAIAVAGINGIPIYDQRGSSFPRIRDGRIDMGAAEVGILRVDTLVDENDGDYTEGDFSLREALAMVPSTIDEDVIAFDPTLFANGPATIILTEGELDVADSVTIYGPPTESLTISAIGNDPTPGVLLGDGSRVFYVHNAPEPGGFGTTPDVELHNLTLTGGDVNGPGGAIYVVDGPIIGGNGLAIYNSLIHGNSATGDGGAVYARVGGLTIVNSTVVHNSAGGYGGAISVRVFSVLLDGNLTRNFRMLHSTVTQNSAGIDGGGVYLEGGGARIENSIVALNSASDADKDDLWQRLFNAFNDLDFSYSLIGIAPSQIIPETPSGIPDAQGNLVGGILNGSIDPRLEPLALNGGPTKTMALSSSSPAIDAGDPNIEPGIEGTPKYDQRGSGYARKEGSRIDIGAFELQFRPDSADFDEDGDVDGIDFLSWQRSFPMPTPLATPSDGDANHDRAVDGKDLTIWEQQYGELPSADFDTDGDVDGLDFLKWQQEFGIAYNSSHLSAWESAYGQESSPVSGHPSAYADVVQSGNAAGEHDARPYQRQAAIDAALATVLMHHERAEQESYLEVAVFREDVTYVSATGNNGNAPRLRAAHDSGAVDEALRTSAAAEDSEGSELADELLVGEFEP